VLTGFAVTEKASAVHTTKRPIISLERSQALTLRTILRQVYDSITDVESVFLALSGGVRVSLDGFTNDRLAAMSFALYDASERVVKTLRNSSLENVLCETGRIRHFIYSIPNGVFSLWVDRDSQKLGLIRLLLKHYIEETRRILASAPVTRPTIPDDLKELLLSDSSEGLIVARRGM
jgi:predicted regulator of Ras-like GTPase activity (Roadblock/LC7/MglB family)